VDHTVILARLTDLFREIFDDDRLQLTPDTAAADVPGWDSMNHITIVVEAERRFGVKFRTGEIEDLRNVGEFIALIEQKTS
jgi:acyl carrier protein